MGEPLPYPKTNPSELAWQAARAERMGEPIASGHRSYDLMRSLQLGIVFSTARTAQPPPPAAGGSAADADAPVAEPSASEFAEQVGACLGRRLAQRSCTALWI